MPIEGVCAPHGSTGLQYGEQPWPFFQGQKSLVGHRVGEKAGHLALTQATRPAEVGGRSLGSSIF
jgi:hypothetical protein